MKIKKRLLSLVLALFLIIGVVPIHFTREEVSKIAGSIYEEGSAFVMTVAEQLRQQGIQEVELKGRKASARELIKMGLSAELIAQATKLTIGELIELRKEISN